MPAHPIVHIEIPATDAKTAGKFYSDLFDWKMEHDPNLNYVQFTAEGGPGGGFAPLGQGDPNGFEVKPGNVLIYIDTDDIEGTLARVESLGGKILVPKSEIPTVGWYGFFTDPTGNPIGLYTSLNQAS